jgi:hypothetical protein
MSKEFRCSGWVKNSGGILYSSRAPEFFTHPEHLNSLLIQSTWILYSSRAPEFFTHPEHLNSLLIQNTWILYSSRAPEFFTHPEHLNSLLIQNTWILYSSRTPEFIPCFSGVPSAQSLVFCVVFCRPWHRTQSLDFFVMVGILLVGFVWLNLLFSVSWSTKYNTEN